MNKLRGFSVYISMAVFTPFISFSQYIVNGNAVQESCNCYVLTPPAQWQVGSVWQNTKINLNDPFEFSFNVYLGCRDIDGADGLAFILQPNSTSVGTGGEGLGFQGIVPSIGISLDTYQNQGYNDPVGDHISIQPNGIYNHTNDLAGPVPASASSDNIEDCAWHAFRIKWDPATYTLSAYFDGVFRLSTQIDIVADIFKNDPMVYWGFSSATGGSYNLQKFCTPLVPGYNSGLPNDAVCLGTPVTFTDSSTSFTTLKNYYWDFGDGATSDVANPPPHVYAQPGYYQVKHTVTAADGCVSQPFTKTISIGDNPDVSIEFFDTCESIAPRLNVIITAKVGIVDQWKWELDGVSFSNSEYPDLSNLAPGNHTMKLTVTSDVGCVSNVFSDDFIIKNKPLIAFNASDGCKNEPVIFTAEQTDNITTINKWFWNFGNNITSAQKDTQNTYATSGNYPVKLTAYASNGCMGATARNIFINTAIANAGNDTVVLPNTFFQLDGSGGSLYLWSPSTGLSNPNISNPMGNVSNDITYHLTVKTVEGCTDTAAMKVIVFRGSAIYVPTAFTPNNDGLNDILKPYFIGIKSLAFFTIYDRWGKKVFFSNEPDKGWDGYSQGKLFETGSYVWALKAVDLIGKVYDLKGTFILIK